jgi:Matrixin
MLTDLVPVIVPRISLILGVLLLFESTAPSALAGLLEQDLVPEPLLSAPRQMPLTFGFDSAQSGSAPSGDWVSIVKEALKEWDDVMCNVDTLFWGDSFDVSVQWQDKTYFMGRGWDNALGVYVPSEDEIYFNSSFLWSFQVGKPPDGEMSFQAVAKHEIGHALGLGGDWGQKDPSQRPSWAKPDEIMWGVFAYGTDYDGLKRSDLRLLKEAGYTHVVPEPTSILSFLSGLSLVGGGYIGIRKGKRHGNKKTPNPAV